MIPFIKPYYDEEDIEAVKQVLASGWVAQGPKVEQFEEELTKYLHCKHAITTTNCTQALTLALQALGIGPGDEVIVPDFTFPATALAVCSVGAKPVLCDVDLHTYNVLAEDIELLVTKNTRAIIPVHLFGLSAEMDAIMDLADDNNLFVVEDAACSLGAIYGQDYVGTIGDIGCFSFQASKGITMGEGGLIVTNDDELAERVRRLSCFGDERTFRRGKTKAPFRFDPRAGNYKMSDITAAIGLAQLHKIEKLIDWRIKIAEEWDAVILRDDYLSESLINIPSLHTDRSHIYQSYVVVAQQGKRVEVQKYFADKGFQTGIGTHACHRYPDAFETDGFFPVSDKLFDSSISLSRYYGLEVEKEWYSAR
jgi:dTDP-4-amino-4,6-dideoxygalactose transaminase